MRGLNLLGFTLFLFCLEVRANQAIVSQPVVRSFRKICEAQSSIKPLKYWYSGPVNVVGSDQRYDSFIFDSAGHKFCAIGQSKKKTGYLIGKQVKSAHEDCKIIEIEFELLKISDQMTIHSSKGSRLYISPFETFAFVYEAADWFSFFYDAIETETIETLQFIQLSELVQSVSEVRVGEMITSRCYMQIISPYSRDLIKNNFD